MEIINHLNSGDFITINLFGKDKEVKVFSTGDNQFDETGNYKDDGFVKAKKLGRIDKFNKWKQIKDNWVSLYKEKEIKEGLTAKHKVTFEDEWLCEAYMKTDYSGLQQKDFQRTINDYLAYLVRSGD